MAKQRVARRIDPKSRPPDGARPWDKLILGPEWDPTRHVVYVNPNDELQGVEFYENLGYEQVLHGQGLRPAMKVKGESGNVVSVLGQIAMWCSAERKAEIDAYGISNNGGQSYIDEIEERILKPGGIDGMRGMHGTGFTTQNETGRPTKEVVYG